MRGKRSDAVPGTAGKPAGGKPGGVPAVRDAVPRRAAKPPGTLSVADKIILSMLASLGVLAALYAWEIELARQTLEGAV